MPTCRGGVLAWFRSRLYYSFVIFALLFWRKSSESQRSKSVFLQTSARASWHSPRSIQRKKKGDVLMFRVVTELASDTLQKYSVILLYPVWSRLVLFWWGRGGSNLKLKQSKAEVQGHGITRTWSSNIYSICRGSPSPQKSFGLHAAAPRRKDKPPSSYPVSSSSRSPPDLSDWGERAALWRRWFGVRRERVFPWEAQSASPLPLPASTPPNCCSSSSSIVVLLGRVGLLLTW